MYSKEIHMIKDDQATHVEICSLCPLTGQCQKQRAKDRMESDDEGGRATTKAMEELLAIEFCTLESGGVGSCRIRHDRLDLLSPIATPHPQHCARKQGGDGQ